MKTWIKRYWIDAVRLVTAVIAGVLLIIGINGLSQTLALSKKTNDIANQNKTLSDQIKTLSEQNKKIGEDNHILSTQNQAFIKCIASLFATYTQTGRAVYIDDLEKCAYETSTPPDTSHTSQNGSQTGSNAGSGQSNDAPPGTPSNPSPPQPKKESNIQKVINFIKRNLP